MTSLLSLLFVVLASLLAIPAAVFFVEVATAVALAPRRTHQRSSSERRQRVAVIVPAHNESSGLVPTITDIRAQLGAGDRLLVVADNCVDDTASVAASSGAEVIKRDDPTRVGKGYALDFALKHLSLDPPAVVVVIDADCRVSGDAIDRLAFACAITQRPVQAIDLMTAQDNSPINYRVRRVCLAREELGSPTWTRRSGTAVPAHGHRNGVSLGDHSLSPTCQCVNC